MNEYSIEIAVGQRDGQPVTEESFTSIADAFFELDSVDEHDVTADGNILVFAMAVSAGDEVQALTVAMSSVRAAIHAAGGGTAGWDDNIATLRTVIEPEKAETAVDEDESMLTAV